MKLSKKWPIIAALLVFLLGAGVAVTRGIISEAYVGRRQNWALGNTISYYVGTTTWTAAMFAVLAVIAAGLTWYYLWKMGQAWRMPRVHYYLVMTFVVALVWLAMCPVGYADYAGHVSLVSRMHEVASRTMFMMMALIALSIALKREASAKTRALSAAYVVLAVISVLGYLTDGWWFMPALLNWESGYILAFLLLMAVARRRGTSQ